MKARIIRIISKEYTILSEDGQKYTALLSGKIRRQAIPAAGDLVEAGINAGQVVIQKILPRRNHLIRPFVANVDQALIIMSVMDPDFSVTLIDRLTILIEKAGITPVLVVTKCDRGIPEQVERQIQEYENGPLQVIRTGKGQLNNELPDMLSLIHI